MLRWTSLVLGGATFLVAHAIERMWWTMWFSAEWEPFFMNSGRAVAFTTACLLIAGLIAAGFARDRPDALVHAGNVTAGAGAVMIVTVFAIGPGTLFPIAILFGLVILAVGSYLGALVIFPFKPAGGSAGTGGGRTRA
ncbi:MAG: hypothetical protein ABI868_21055 [Acidobacteriota bacterium]